MNKKPNYYQLLHLHSDAPAPIIKTAYRTIMQKLKAHPDLGGDAGQAALLNEAYEILSDPAKRAAYDKQLAASQRAAKQGTATGKQEQRTKQRREQHTEQRTRQSTENREPNNASAGARSNARNSSAAAGAAQYGRAANDGNLRGHHCMFCLSPQSSPDSRDSSCSICGSPLAEDNQWADDGNAHNSRRQILRLPRTGPLSFCRQIDFSPLGSAADFANRQAVRAYAAQALDVSPSGMRMQCRLALGPDELLRVENQALIAIASIANRERAGDLHSYGLRFLRLQLKQSQGGFLSTAV